MIPSTTSLDAVAQLIRDLRDAAADHTGSLEGSRRALDQGGANFELPEGMLREDVMVSATLSAERLIPRSAKPGTILYFHGGGYSVGSTVSHRPLCAMLAQHGRRELLAINYRLAPEHRFPAAVEDAIEAYRWLLSRGAEAGEVIFAGDSAGGGLALSALQMLAADADGRELPMPAGAVGLSPWLDLECSSPSYETNGDVDLLATASGLRFVGRAYADAEMSTNPLVSPFYAPSLAGLCPLLLQVGSAETLLDEVVHIAKIARESGVEVELQVWENMVHVWHSFPDHLPESERALLAVGRWLDQRLSPADEPI